MLLARAIGLDQLVHDGLGAFEHEFLLIAAFEKRAAQRVDRFALLVHHVVVFQKMFARFEVLRFDRLLRVFDPLADQPRFDGHALGHSQPVHDGLHALAAENPQQVVLEREEKSRRAGIALPPGAPAKLIVNAPRLVALGAQNVQSAHGHHFVMFRFALRGELIVERLPLIERHLEDFAFLLEQHHRRAFPRRSPRRLPRRHPPAREFPFRAPRRSPDPPADTASPVFPSGNSRASSLRDCRRAKYRFRGPPCSSRPSRRPCARPAQSLSLRARAASRSAPGAGSRARFRCSAIFSDFSIEMLPTSTGWPLS